jgi:Tol biopolymer transport system component
MIRIDRLERDLTAWFVETAVPRTPDYTELILRQTAGMRQRPRWSFPERWLPMSAVTLGRRTLKPLPWRTIGLLAILVLLLAAALAVYVGSQRQLPEPFGLARNGQIAFSRDGNIVAVDPVSASTVTIVSGPELDQFPAWSPHGTRIAFERSVPGGAQLVAVNSVGDQLMELLARPVGAVRGLTWSPDGSALAFSNGDLWVVAADGSGGRLLDIGFRAEFPLWRPPDGREILFSNGSGPGLFLVRRDGTVLRPVTFADGTFVLDESATWTHDGQRLVTFREDSGQGDESLYRIHVLTLGPDARVADDRVVGSSALPCTGGSLSPDGARVLFAVQAPDGAGWRIGVIALDGSGLLLTSGPSFAGSDRTCAWSPDGTVIVVNDLDREETWLLDPNGGAARPASWTDVSGEPPAWQRMAP